MHNMLLILYYTVRVIHMCAMWLLTAESIGRAVRSSWGALRASLSHVVRRIAQVQGFTHRSAC